jgi:hypothetical protein
MPVDVAHAPPFRVALRDPKRPVEMGDERRRPESNRCKIRIGPGEPGDQVDDAGPVGTFGMPGRSGERLRGDLSGGKCIAGASRLFLPSDAVRGAHPADTPRTGSGDHFARYNLEWDTEGTVAVTGLDETRKAA